MAYKKAYLTALLLVVCFTSLIFSMPRARAQEAYPLLRECADPNLQQGLEDCISTLNLDQATRNESLCVALVDISDPKKPHLAVVNGDKMLYAASLPKIAILLGAFESYQEGRLTIDRKTRQKLTRMIRSSSNLAATEMLDRVGNAYLIDLLQSDKYGLYDPKKYGGLWVGKPYGKSPAWKRDPLNNLSHGATALQVARFYYLLETGRLVSPAVSRQMKTILSRPAVHHKFVKGLQSAHPDSRIYRKSGTWRQFHSDSAIVEREGRRYIAVALARHPNGGQWLSKLIVAMDNLIERYATAATVARLDERIQ